MTPRAETTCPTMILKTFYLILSASVVTGCGVGWVKFNGFCFMFSHDKMTWPEASETCRDLGAFLAEPSSPELDHFLSNHTRKTNPKKIFWIGASDIEQEGHWTWITTRLPFSYTNWRPTDPNNAGPGEDCLLTNWYGSGQWEDGNCEWTEYFICQAEDEFIVG